MYTVGCNEYAEKLFLYTSVGVCGRIHVKIDRNSTRPALLKRQRSHKFYIRSRGPLEIHQSDEKNTEISQTTTQSLPYQTVLPKNIKKQQEGNPELGRLLKRRLKTQSGSCKHGVYVTTFQLPPFMEDSLNLSRKVIRRKKSENGYSLRTRTL